MYSLSIHLSKLTKPLFKKRGFTEFKIIQDWDNIIGPEFAAYTNPVKIAFNDKNRKEGTLYIEVYNNALATKLFYLEPMIIEKIAVYFGYKAVTKLKINYKPLKFASVNSESNVVKEISSHKTESLLELIKEIDDPELKDVLFSFGKSIIRKNSSK
jgi:hypothetical protein